MFGLSVEHLLILLVAGLFILGPERLPSAAASLARMVRQVRSYAAGAQKQLEAELGPDFDEIRRPLRELGTLRDPRRAVTRYLLEDFEDRPAVPPRPAVPKPAASPGSPPGLPAPSRKVSGVDFEAT
jgi:sec-independent protein translocase protein TatB